MSHDDAAMYKRSLETAALEQKTDLEILLDRIETIENRYISAETILQLHETIDTWKHVYEIELNILRRSDRELSVRIEILEKLNQQCFDANPIKDIYKRFEKLEVFRESYVNQFERNHDWISRIEAHLNKLHDMINLEDRITAKDVLDRLTEVEGLANATRDAYNSMCAPSLKKTPHKCPVCDGIGINCLIGEFRSLPIKADICQSCEGKGIVWG